MYKKVNISKIASDLGISVSTVSRALSGKGRVSEITRKRIEEYLAEKELVPNIREKKYTDTVTKVISVVIPEKEYFVKMLFFYNIFFSVYDYFSIRGYQVQMIKVVHTDISDLVKAVETHAMDGVILAKFSGRDRAVNYLKEKGVPFVVLESYEDSSILQVDVDYENASNEITNALISKGFHRLAVMCDNRDNPVNERKLKGILSAHVQNYMVLDRNFIFYDTEFENMAEMVIKQVTNAKMDCILCMDDYICMVILKVLKKMKMDVPGDIRIASLQGSALLQEWYPSVSCIFFNVEQMGKEASRMLYACLTEYKFLPRMVLGYELRMRDSTN